MWAVHRHTGIDPCPLRQHPSTDPDGLYKAGCLALYRAKADGRNTVRFATQQAGFT